MRWGVREDAQDDHQTTQIVLREVERCQKISQGPNFVVSIVYIHEDLRIYIDLLLWLYFLVFLGFNW